MKTQRLTAVCHIFPHPAWETEWCIRTRYPFILLSWPLERQKLSQIISAMICKETERGGSPGYHHDHWWTFAEYQWTKCEAEQNKIWWAILGPHAETLLLLPRVEVKNKIKLYYFQASVELKVLSWIGTEIKKKHTKKQKLTAGIFCDWFPNSLAFEQVKKPFP